MGPRIWRKNGEQTEKVQVDQLLSDVSRETDLWRRRAERIRGEHEAVKAENRRLWEENRILAEKLVDLATHPPVPPPPITPDIPAILEQFRRTIQPDVVVNGRPDASDEQRAGINWSHQGLDNTGGTPENLPDLFDPRPTIPDYVLDIENLDPNSLKGSRGGWYNPPDQTHPSRPDFNSR